MNSTRKNILVVVVGYLAYVILFNLGDWSFIGCLGALAAGACLGNLILTAFPLTGKRSDWSVPLVASVLPILGVVFLRNNASEYPSTIHTAEIGALIVIIFGLLSIPYRIVNAKIRAMDTKENELFGFEEEDSE